MLFLYPLRASPLILMLLSSFMIWLGLMNFILWLLGILAFVVFVLGFAKYLFSVLKHTANGFTKPPILTVELLHPFEEWGPYKFILISAIVYAFSAWLTRNNLNTVAVVVIVFYLILLPAFISHLGVGDSLIHSINPLRLTRFVYRTGVVYWMMLGLLALAAIMIYSLYKSGPGLFIALFVTSYTLVLIFHCIGKIIYLKRDVLDYFPDQSPEREAEKLAHEILLNRKKCMDRVFRLRRQGSVIPIILAYVETEEDKLMAHQWFHDQLIQWDNKRLAVKHGSYYIKVLREAGKSVAADALTREFQSIDPTFSCE